MPRTTSKAVGKSEAAASTASTHPPRPEDPEALARVRQACAELHGVTEKLAWAAPTFRVSEKMFAMLVVQHHGDHRTALWCAAPPGMQALLAETAPERTFTPPYVGHRGWIALDLAHTDDLQLKHHLAQAWLHIAPAKLREKWRVQLDG